MLRNRIFMKRIRNLVIFIMAIVILIGTYSYVRRSRAENVIQIELEAADRSEALALQTEIANATEAEDGNFLLTLPTAINGNVVSKYYTTDGIEVDMKDANANKTIALTGDEIANQKIQLQIDYDKKDITTEDGQVVTLYNKELMDEKKTEEATEETTDETSDETTDQVVELDDSIIVTGYMPLDARVDINEIDISGLDIQIPSDTQTVQKGYEVSIYQTVRKTVDAEGNVIAEEVVIPDNLLPEDMENEGVTVESGTETNIASESAMIEEGTHIEEEKVEYNPSVYNAPVEIKTRNTEENTMATTYSLQEDNQIMPLESTVGEEYADATILKDNQTIKYLLATEPDPRQNEGLNSLQASTRILSTTLTDGNMLRSTNTEVASNSPFLGNTNLERGDITSVTFVSSTSGANSTAWDVSEAQNGSIMAWYETDDSSIFGTKIMVYIGSNETIYANTDSSYLFSRIGSIILLSEAEPIKNINLLNTSQVINMSYMFTYTGFYSMTTLDLGDNFDTSRVTNMSNMFNNTGGTGATGLDLGDKFDTSNVTNMDSMFFGTCIDMINLDLGNKFDTSNATSMTMMFFQTGRNSMTSLDLGPLFTNIAGTTTSFANTGKEGECVIYAPEEIYQDSTHFKLNSSSTQTIEFTNGRIEMLPSNCLRTTNNEISPTSGFLGNTSIQRQNIDNITFVEGLAGANSTAWDVSSSQNGSIKAWYETNSNGTYKVYIGSDEPIFANPDSSYLFAYIGHSSNCTSKETITNINLLYTRRVTNMSNMFVSTGSASMTNLDLGEKFDTNSVTNMQAMFDNTGRESMTSLKLGDNFNTHNVTNMGDMFSNTGTNALTSLDLGNNFDTSNVTNMYGMFFNTGANAMTNLNLGLGFTQIPSGEITEGIDTYLAYDNMFTFTGKEGEIVITVPQEIYQDEHHVKLNENSSTTIEFTRGRIELIPYNYLRSTNNETNEDSGFLGNTDIQRQYINNVTFMSSISKANDTAWDVSAEQNGSIMAWYETKETGEGKLYKVYIGSNGYIYANPNSSYLFSYIGYGSNCTSTETITNIELLNTSTATDMNSMFTYTGHHSMTSLDLGDNFDTSNVTNMANMFSLCGFNKMRRLDLGSKFNTSKVRDMSYMFGNTGQQELSNFSLGNNFDTSNVTNMQGMFQYFGSKISSLDLGSKFDTSNVTNMYRMFKYCGYDGLTTFDIGDNFNTSKVTNMSEMFAYFGREKLTNLNLGDYFYTTNVTSCAYVSMTSLELGPAFTRIANTNTNMFNSTGKENECIIYVPEEIYIDEHHVKLNETSSTQIEYTRGTFNITGQNYSYLRNTSSENAQTSGFLGNTSIQRQNIDNVTFVDNLNGMNDTAWDVSEAQDGSIMAWYESNANGTYKVYIGSEGTICANPDSTRLFSYIGFSSNCTSTEAITNINLLDTSKVTNMSNMFSWTGYTAMTSLDLGENFDTSNVTDMSNMFSGTGHAKMTNFDLGENFDTSNVTDMSWMFNSTGDTAMTSLDLGDKFHTSNVTDMSYMFNGTGYTAMTSLDLGDKFDTSNVIDMSWMFYSTGNIAMTSLDLGENFDTSNVTDMRSMFNRTGYTAMTTLDLGSAFTNIASTNTDMFTSTGKSGEIVIYVPEEIYVDNHHVKLNETSSTQIEFTRGTFNQLTMNYLKSTSTENIMTSGFLGNTSIQRQNIDNVTFVDSLSGANSTAWDVSEAQDGSIKAWYTSTNGTYKVYIGSDGPIYANPDSSNLFCFVGFGANSTSTETITNLNLLNTSQVTNMSKMFNLTGMTAMTTLNLGDNFDTSKVTNMSNMFASTGKQITNLDLGNKFDTSNVTNMAGMFAGLNVTNLDLGDNFNTSKVTDMSTMFQSMGYYNLTSLDLGDKFDTSSVTTMMGMFDCTGYENMTTLDLGENFDTSNVTDFTGMFSNTGHDSLTSLDLGDKFNTYRGGVDAAGQANMSSMFFSTGATSMTSLRLGKAFKQISSDNTYLFQDTGKSGEIVIYVPEVIYQDNHHAKYTSNYNDGRTVEFTRGTFNPIGDSYTLRSAEGETSYRAPFLGNPYNLARTSIEEVIFVNSTSGANSNKWDVSAARDNSVIAWYENDANNDTIVYIGSDGQIYANENSKYLFSSIAQYSEEANVIKGLNLLDTSKVTNMSDMFGNVGGTSLDLGDNFDTSNVTDMTDMFSYTGYNTNMTNIDLGESFTHIAENHTGMFDYTGKEGEIVIYVPDIIFQDEHHAKLDEDSTQTIEFTRGYFNKISEKGSVLKSTASEVRETDGFLGNTSIQRQNIDQVEFVDYISEVMLPSDSSLLRKYDATNNTGSGHSSTTTTWTDLSGHQNGTVHGATWGEDYLSFNGTTSTYVSCGNINVTNKVTIDATIVAKSIQTSERDIISNWQGGGVGLKIQDGIPYFTIYVNGGYADVKASKAVTVGEKTRITGTYDGSKMCLYINGKLVAQKAQTGTIGAPQSNTILMMGCNPSGSSVDPSFPYPANINIYSVSVYGDAVSSNMWDVSEAQDGSIMAWYEAKSNGTYKVYIGSNDKIFANPDSSRLFSYIGYSTNCTSTETILNLDLLNTSKVTKMDYMFTDTGYKAMTSLDLGENFDTSNVTSMYGMFWSTGETYMTSLDLRENFDTSNVTDMRYMFYRTGYWAMTNLDLGDKFDTSNVYNMGEMFHDTGFESMTSLDLGDKFNTKMVGNMYAMFMGTGGISMTNLDLGPAFTSIPENQEPSVGNENMFMQTGKSNSLIIQAPEAIYKDQTHFKDSASLTVPCNDRGQTIIPKYRTEWIKDSVSVDTTDASNPKMNITIRGTTNPEAGTDYISDVTSTLTTANIKIYVDDEEATSITKSLSSATQSTNPTTGAQDVTYTLTLSNFEESTLQDGKDYMEWSGNVRVDIAQGTLSDTTGPEDENGNTITYGNKNMSVADDGSRQDSRIEDETKVDKNTANTMFMDYIKPTIKYEYSETDVDHDGKSFTMEICIADKYMAEGSSIADLDIRIDGEEPDWTKVYKIIKRTVLTEEVSGDGFIYEKTIGVGYIIELYNLEQLQVKEGDKYLDYSGVVTVAIPANQIIDASGNGNDATTITSGISLPGGEGTEEVVDFVRPTVEKVESSVDVDAKTATIKFQTTDKYITQNNPLESGDIQVLVNGSANTSITKTINNTVLTEQRTQNGTTSTVQYGYEYTLTLSGIDTTVNQIKVRIPANAITDQSGNGNEQTDLILLNTLKNTSTEQYADSGFLGNSLGMMQRQNIENITFVNHIPEDVYDVSTNTYKNNNAWDASAQGDNSIIAWYEQNENDALKVYIGSNDEIFANTNSSYLFSYVGSSYNCTSTEIITNIELLNTSNVTNMNHMFSSTGYVAMTSLDLGSNFDTSNVTDMSYMFNGTGMEAMTSLDLGDKFDTSKVTNMTYMFVSTGRQAMINLALGDNFDTSSVTNMTNMFDGTGYDEMTSLDLGDKFDTSSVTNMSYMFSDTGYTKMTSLDLGDKFDTSSVTNMSYMFQQTGYTAMTSLDLGDKFDTSKVTDMNAMFKWTGYTKMTNLDLGDKFKTSAATNTMEMFFYTGYTAMTSLDLGPAFTNIPSNNAGMFLQTGKSGIVVYAPEAIYQDSRHFKLNSGSTTTLGWMDGEGNIITNYGTINPKYRTEWVKENASIDTSDANNPKINITIRGTTNPDVPASEYASNVTSTLANTDIKVYIDSTMYTSNNITDSATIAVGTATTTTNTRTGAQDVLQTITITNFEEAERILGKAYKEWSGNIRLEIAQGTLTDTTNANDTTITYGNSNVSIINDGTGTRTDSTIEDETKVDKNTTGAMFADFIKPEFTYIYSSTDINYDQKTLTVTFSVVDKFFNSTTGLTNADGITVKMIDENVVPENLTKTITKTRDITETRNNTSIKIGEEYTLTVTGFEQAQMAEDGKYKDYSGPVSIAFPASIVSDKSGNTNIAKTITVGINEPDQSGTEEIVDFVKPTWKAENLQIDTENKEATVDLIGTDKYFESGSLDVSQIKVIVDGEEVTDTTSVIKELSTPTSLTETRDGASVQYGVKYTLTLNGWKQTDEAFQASEKRYREYSGNTQIIIEEGTLIDESGNESDETTLDLGFIDVVDPEVYQISVTKNVDEKTDTIIFDVVDKYFASSSITTTNTEGLTVYVDDEEAIGVTKTIVDIEDITATVNGSEKKIGERYTLVLSNFEQERTTPVDYDREYSDWSGTVTVKVAPGLIEDSSGNTNQEVLDVETISKDIEYLGYYADVDGNGSVDGVIYADLAVGKSGTWGDINTGTYSYATETGLKEYYISQTNYTGDFGTKDVITALEGSVGKERFYVMSLENFNDGNGPRYTWYDAAAGQMDDYATATSTDFGAGKTNTANMIAKWNASDYGPQDDNDTYKDMWGVIQEEVEKGWFVPSRAEWAAFGSNLNITKDDYADYNLSILCWSSSQLGTYTAWYANFSRGYMYRNDVLVSNYVRLSATF